MKGQIEFPTLRVQRHTTGYQTLKTSKENEDHLKELRIMTIDACKALVIEIASNLAKHEQWETIQEALLNGKPITSTIKLPDFIPSLKLCDTLAHFAAEVIALPLAKHASNGYFNALQNIPVANGMLDDGANKVSSRLIKFIFKFIRDENRSIAHSQCTRKLPKKLKNLGDKFTQSVRDLTSHVYKSTKLQRESRMTQSRLISNIAILKDDIFKSGLSVFSGFFRTDNTTACTQTMPPSKVLKLLEAELKKYTGDESRDAQENQYLVINQLPLMDEVPEKNKRPKWEYFFTSQNHEPTDADHETRTSYELQTYSDAERIWECFFNAQKYHLADTDGRPRIAYEPPPYSEADLEVFTDTLTQTNLKQYFSRAFDAANAQKKLPRHSDLQSPPIRRKKSAMLDEPSEYLSKPVNQFISLIFTIHRHEILKILHATTLLYMKYNGDTDITEFWRLLEFRVFRAWFSNAIIRLSSLMGERWPKLSITAEDANAFMVLIALEQELTFPEQDNMPFDTKILLDCICCILRSVTDSFREKRTNNFAQEAKLTETILNDSVKRHSLAAAPHQIMPSRNHGIESDSELIQRLLNKTKSQLSRFEKPTLLRVFLCALSGLTVIGPLIIIALSEYERKVLCDRRDYLKSLDSRPNPCALRGTAIHKHRNWLSSLCTPHQQTRTATELLCQEV